MMETHTSGTDRERTRQGGTRPVVLVIDDEPSFIEAVALFLDSHGFGVVRALTGREGLSRFEQEPGDVAVVDVHLPDISGLEVAAQLHRSDTAPPVIVISSDDSVQTLLASQEAGACAFLPKPLPPQQLLDAIRRALRIGPQPD